MESLLGAFFHFCLPSYIALFIWYFGQRSVCPSIITAGWDDPGGHGRATDERFNVIASTQAKKFLFSFNCCGIRQRPTLRRRWTGIFRRWCRSECSGMFTIIWSSAKYITRSGWLTRTVRMIRKIMATRWRVFFFWRWCWVWLITTQRMSATFEGFTRLADAFLPTW